MSQQNGQQQQPAQQQPVQQQQQQTQNLPQHRIEEIANELKALKSENRQLRNTLDETLIRQQRQQYQQPQEEESQFDDGVRQAMKKEFNQMLKPYVDNFQTSVGNLAEDNDLLRFQLKYGVETYSKNRDKIEELRQQRVRQGQWTTRDDAWRYIHFDEKDKAPKIDPPPPQPVLDRYGDVINGPQTQQGQQMPQQMQQPMNQPVQQQMAQPNNMPNLPPQGVVEQTFSQPRNEPVPNIDLGSSEEDIKAWEDSVANKPF